MDFIVFPISRHVNFLRFKFSATGHTFYQKKIMVSRINFKPLWIPQTTLNLEDIT